MPRKTYTFWKIAGELADAGPKHLEPLQQMLIGARAIALAELAIRCDLDSLPVAQGYVEKYQADSAKTGNLPLALAGRYDGLPCIYLDCGELKAVFMMHHHREVLNATFP